MKSSIFILAFVPLLATAQQYSIDWHTVDAGGGTSTGGVYSVSGTIGQPDAATSSGGGYTVTGGFWSRIAVIQTPGLPLLSISRSGNAVVVSWPSTASCTLQTNDNAADGQGWIAYTGTISTLEGTNSITLAQPPAGKLFFRLKE